MSVACLPWYDFPETRPFTDRFWRRIAECLTEAGCTSVPDRLLREVHHDEVLSHPDLLLSQTCGYVVATDIHDLVDVVATPWYRAPGCEETNYRSYVVVREGLPVDRLADARGLRCVVNEPWSHSGLNALRILVAPLHDGGRFFASVQRSGSHLNSLAALAADRADLACIDCVTFELVRRYRPDLLAGIRIVCTTAGAPAPPFVTAAGGGPELVYALRKALAEVLTDPANEEICNALLIDGVERMEPDSYAGMAIDADRARALGYLEMELSLEDPDDGLRNQPLRS